MAASEDTCKSELLPAVAAFSKMLTKDPNLVYIYLSDNFGIKVKGLTAWFG
jgi:hypothetical protein